MKSHTESPVYKEGLGLTALYEERPCIPLYGRGPCKDLYGRGKRLCESSI
jgi:hypothetical protein